MTTSIIETRERRLTHDGGRGIRALAAGETIVMIDDSAIVLMACAGTVTTAQMAFIIRHTGGFVQVALHEVVCDRLLLAEAIPSDRYAPAHSRGQCVAVDAAMGTTTGISGTDRARTARVLADPSTEPNGLTRPGHLVPVRVKASSGTARTVPALALKLADWAHPSSSGAVFADLESSDDPTQLANSEEAVRFADRHGLVAVHTGRTSAPGR
ncbi:3,4-dihydroxy-2-butanone-4-phosphate synthase (plasmid) [Rhodococcus sp. USK10]|uniref:3,4-dihydroxy-2-butanone-4-phosphate synthase n=1 Tax=Rhodococcus sp. USK10 TaxID=2789739 RepID=UPI001C5D21D0|nr:3,4-dihydroxy-2-butanone-4-phosphate synthase [Rhodococcus sp. USK10]QYA99861.1 3,4-dihydroxy-2-butanone-4-phosphate synthase [Rhodococcus sp. USK10]